MSRAAQERRGRAAYWIAACLLPLLGGCHLPPPHEMPHPPVPAQWSTAVAEGSAAWPSTDWWKAFGNQELDQLIEQARRASPDVQAAVYRVREAEAQAEIAGAPLLPSVDAGASVGPERSLNLIGEERHHILYQGLVQVHYEFDFWGKNKAALQSAQASAQAARYAQQVVWLTTSVGVANLYFQDLALQDRIKTARENLERAKRTLEDVSFAERHGTVARLAVVEQQTAVADVEALLPPLEQQLAATQNALAILVGEMPEDLHVHGHSILDLAEPEITVGMPSELLERRPDIQEAEANLVAADADIRVARAAFLPSFTLPLDVGVASMTLSHGTVPPLGIYSLLASVSQPIFHGGALKGKLKQSQARYQELLVGAYRQAVLSSFGDVENALAALRAARAEKSSDERAAALAQQSAGMALGSLQGGTGTELDVLQTQSTVLTAQDALVQARLAYADALLSLIKALGGGWKA